MGRRKIEELTTAWYLFTLFSGAISFFLNGIGFFSLFISVLSTGIALVIAWAIGKALLAKSNLMRWVVIALSGLGVVLGALGILQLLAAFLTTWQLGLLGTAVMAVLGIGMQVYTLRVLFDGSVSRYFR